MKDGKLVRLRAIEESDLETLARWVNDPEVMALTGPYTPIPMGKQRRWYENLLADESTHVFAIEAIAENRLIGTCGLYDIHWRIRKAELRIRIGDKDVWGKGYGTESTRLLTDFGFSDLNLHRIFLSVFAHNERAIRLYQKCGFQHEGVMKDHGYTDGRYTDVVYMGHVRPD